MPAPTSTLVTLRSRSDQAVTLLRLAAGDKNSPKETAPPLETVKEHDFFWTYTEEPHRTRRQAIIKAHPEVRDLANLEVNFN